MKYQFITIIILLTSTIAANERPSLINNMAPQFTLLDQYNKPYNIAQDQGKIILLLASDAEGAKQNKAWVENIDNRYNHRIPIVGIADVRQVPRPLKALARKEFKKTPVSILLDWNGDVFISYGLVKKLANIVLIDKKGVVRYMYSGAATATSCAILFREIDKLDNE